MEYRHTWNAVTQKIFLTEHAESVLDDWIREAAPRCIMLVCGASFAGQALHTYFSSLTERTGIRVVPFSDYAPNPEYESVVEGVRIFRKEQCDGIIAVGGGSGMDVAKCIRLFHNLPGEGEDGAFLQQDRKPVTVPFLAIPTTAGTGSESTRYAVLYYKGAKQSITDDAELPAWVILHPPLLASLPLYQRKASFLDAVSHAIESLWSVHSTEESEEYAVKALRGSLRAMDAYLAGRPWGNREMLLAANLAGRAINITRTTAGHAMAYKLTTLFGVAHGHAAALCDAVLYPWMCDHTAECVDPRGEAHLQAALARIAECFGCASAREGAEALSALLKKLEMEAPHATEEEIGILKSSVNVERLQNHPIALGEDTLEKLYREFLLPA